MSQFYKNMHFSSPNLHCLSMFKSLWKVILTNYYPVFTFTPPENIRNHRFSHIFRAYKQGAPGSNRLSKTMHLFFYPLLNVDLEQLFSFISIVIQLYKLNLHANLYRRIFIKIYYFSIYNLSLYIIKLITKVSIVSVGHVTKSDQGLH